ncbi:hypothetical protein [Fulvitalea axinellae]
MRQATITLFFFIICVSTTLAQGKYQSSPDAFKSENYTKAEYPLYPKVERIDNVTYKFGKRVIKVSAKEEQFHKIFEKGIFNPDVIFGTVSAKYSKNESKASSKKGKTFHDIFNNPNISVSYFDSLEKLDPNPKKKRFIFWVSREGMLNPTEYYLELYNGEAKKDTSWDEFVENAKMSFFKMGTIII